MVSIANFVINLTELNNTQVAGKILFLGMSLLVFLEEISIWVHRLSRDHSPRVGEHHPILWGPEKNKKVEKG